MTMTTTKPKHRMAASGWCKVAKENVIARQMALAKFKLGDLGIEGGVGLRAVYLCGPPGVGKTQSIVQQEAVWRSRGLEPLRCRPTNVVELLDYFEQARGVRPIVMEEADIIFRSKPMFEVLKQATDPLTPDILYRMKRVGKTKVMIPIRLNVPICVSTNMDLLHDAGWDAKLLPDRDALFNRSMPVVIPNDPHALWEWSIYLALTSHLTLGVMLRNPTGGKPVSASNPLAVQARALDWFTDHIQHLAVISPRTLKQVAQLFGRAHRGDLPAVVLDSELQALLTDAPRADVAVPLKADWSVLLTTMPKLRGPATVGSPSSSARKKTIPARARSPVGPANRSSEHAREVTA